MIKFGVLYVFVILSLEIAIAQSVRHQDSAVAEMQIVGNYGDFIVDITKSDPFLKVKFQVKDSVAQQKLNNDPKYKRLMRLHDKGRFVWNKINGEAFIAGIKKYTVYSSDSVIIHRDSISKLTDLIHRIRQLTDDELVNRKVSYIDGFEIQLIIKTSDGFREIFAHSPSQKYSPLLKDLLHHIILLSNATKTKLLNRTVIKGY